MNRRQLFKKIAGIAGAVLAAPVMAKEIAPVVRRSPIKQSDLIDFNWPSGGIINPMADPERVIRLADGIEKIQDTNGRMKSLANHIRQEAEKNRKLQEELDRKWNEVFTKN